MKKLAGILVMLCITISIFTSCGKSNTKTDSKIEESFIKFETQEGGFSVLLPDNPKHESKTVSTPAGNIDLNMYYSIKDNSEYGVIYNNYPEKIVKNIKIDKLIDSERDSIVAQSKGKLVKETKISIGKIQGRELRIQTDNGEKIAVDRIFFIKNRIYQIIVEKQKGSENGDDVSTFFNSFKLID